MEVQKEQMSWWIRGGKNTDWLHGIHRNNWNCFFVQISLAKPADSGLYASTQHGIQQKNVDRLENFFKNNKLCRWITQIFGAKWDSFQGAERADQCIFYIWRLKQALTNNRLIHLWQKQGESMKLNHDWRLWLTSMTK